MNKKLLKGGCFLVIISTVFLCSSNTKPIRLEKTINIKSSMLESYTIPNVELDLAIMQKDQKHSGYIAVNLRSQSKKAIREDYSDPIEVKKHDVSSTFQLVFFDNNLYRIKNTSAVGIHLKNKEDREFIFKEKVAIEKFLQNGIKLIQKANEIEGQSNI